MLGIMPKKGTFMGWVEDRSDAKLPPATAYARQVE